MTPDVHTAIADLKLELHRAREHLDEVDRALARVIAAFAVPTGIVAYGDSADDGQPGDGFADSRDDATAVAQ